MVDFKKLVEGLLVEQPKTTISYGRGGAGDFGAKPYARQASTTQETSSEEEKTPEDVSDSQKPEEPTSTAKSSAEIDNIRELIKEKTGQESPSLTDKPNFNRHVQEQIFTRGTQYDLIEDNIRPYYPWIDFLCLCNEKSKIDEKDKENIKIQDILASPKLKSKLAEVIKSFADHLNRAFTRTDNQNHPILNYKPFSYRLKSIHDKVIQALLTKGVLGRNAVENFKKFNYTLAEAIDNVVTLRQQKISTKFFNKKKSNKELNEIIKNYQSYLPGGQSQQPETETKNQFAKAFERVKGGLQGKQYLPDYLKGISDYFIQLAEAINTYAASKNIDIDKVLETQVKVLSSDSDAKPIIDALTNLANFIPEKPELKVGEILSAATQVAKGLSLGT